jgi:outer membrane biosynthesis protein TonB
VEKLTTNSIAGARAEDRPPLRPRWLHPASTATVVGIFLAFFASGIYWPQTIVDLGGINADLIPEGVSLEAGDPAPEGDSLEDPLPLEEASLTDEGMDELIADEPPPPLIMEPDEIQAPERKEKAQKKQKVEKPKIEKSKQAEQKTRARREAATDGRRADQTGRRYGLPGGAGQGAGRARIAGRYGLPGGGGDGSGATQATCLAQIAASIRGHTPAVTSLGPGSVVVTFYVNAGGGLSGISVSGGSSAHAAMARRIVASSRGPASCTPVYARQGITFQ